METKVDGHTIDDASVTMLRTLADRSGATIIDENESEGHVRNSDENEDEDGEDEKQTTASTPYLSDAAGFENTGDARYRLTEHLVPLGWVERAGTGEEKPGPIPPATLWEITREGQKWLHEHGDEVDATPAHDAARAVAEVDHLHDRMDALDQRIGDVNEHASEIEYEYHSAAEDMAEASRVSAKAWERSTNAKQAVDEVQSTVKSTNQDQKRELNELNDRIENLAVKMDGLTNRLDKIDGGSPSTSDGQIEETKNRLNGIDEHLGYSDPKKLSIEERVPDTEKEYVKLGAAADTAENAATYAKLVSIIAVLALAVATFSFVL